MHRSLSLSLSHIRSLTLTRQPPLPPSAHRTAIPAGGDGLFSEWRLGRARRVGELELEEGEKREGEREENGEKRALSYWPVSHTHTVVAREGTCINGIGFT